MLLFSFSKPLPFFAHPALKGETWNHQRIWPIGFSSLFVKSRAPYYAKECFSLQFLGRSFLFISFVELCFYQKTSRQQQLTNMSRYSSKFIKQFTLLKPQCLGKNHALWTLSAFPSGSYAFASTHRAVAEKAQDTRAVQRMQVQARPQQVSIAPQKTAPPEPAYTVVQFLSFSVRSVWFRHSILLNTQTFFAHRPHAH